MGQGYANFDAWGTSELDDFLADIRSERLAERVPRWMRGGYEPLPSQGKFHEVRTKFKGFSGPIGSGKSAGFARECIRLAQANPNCWGIVAAPTYPMLQDSTLRALLESLDDAGLRYTHLKQRKYIDIHEYGSRIVYRSLDAPDRLRGPNVAWFGIDELTYAKPEGWRVLEGRLRDKRAKQLCGFACWTAKGFDWVWEKFVENKVGDAEIDCILATPFENTHVAAGYYESLKNSYDPEFYEQEVLGKYLNAFAQQAYRKFDRTRDVRPVAYEWQLPLSLACDFNVDPMAWVIAQFDPKRRQLFVLDEIFLRNTDTDKAIKTFHERIQPYLEERLRYTHAPLEVAVYGDASGNRRTTAAGARSDWAIIREHFAAHRGQYVPTFKVPDSNGSVRDRLNSVNAAFENANHERRTTIDPKCKSLIRDLEQVSVADGGSATSDNDNPMLTHTSDAIGYLIVKEMGIAPKARIITAA